MPRCRHCTQKFEPGDLCPARVSGVSPLPCEARGDGELTMTYPDGSTARLNVPASAICEHKSIRLLCDICKKKGGAPDADNSQS